MTDTTANHHSQTTKAALAKISIGDRMVVAQLGQSLDGRIATASGESKYINGPAALAHLHGLRAEVDAVIIGVGTAMTDDPELTVRHAAGADPAVVIIDPSGRLAATCLCIASGPRRRIVIRATDGAAGQPLPPGVEEIRLPRDGRALPPQAIIDVLYAEGLKRILVEGGAWTISTFIDAGVVDRLHVLMAPVILGSGKMSLALDPIVSLSDALRPQTDVYVFEDGDVLFDCDLRARNDSAKSERRDG